MKEYMFLIIGGEDTSQKPPEEMEVHMQKWQSWMGGLAKQGKLVGGQPLSKEGNTIVGSSKKIIDRPLAEAKELVAGYITVKAETLGEATEIAQDCPVFEFDGNLEVREILPM